MKKNIYMLSQIIFNISRKINIVKTLIVPWVIFVGLEFETLAQSGTVTFTAAEETNLGQILVDGTYSNDISGIQIDVFGAMDAAAAASRTNSGSFVLWLNTTSGYAADVVVPIDQTSGSQIVTYTNLPRVVVIMSNDGSEFSFESIVIGDWSYGLHMTPKLEGFKDGSSTGSITHTLSGSTFDATLTTSELSPAIFGNVDEVRISNTNPTYPQFWAGINNITIAPPVAQPPSTQASSLTFSSVGATQMTIGCTNGNGVGRAIFVKEGTGAITNPSDNTSYTASTDWTSKGTQLGSSGYYCVYNGTGTSVTLTGLSAGTQYTVQAYEYNGTSGSEAYNTSTATNNPNTQTTLSNPVVSSVGVPTNGTYVAGENLDFTVNFNETVNVVTTGGTPFIPLTLNTGGTVNASYLSGTGTTALVFRYTVISGNEDTDGVAVGSSISLNGGTIKSGGSLDATLTLNSVGSTASVLVDAVAPTISSVDVPANNTYGTGENLNFTVNFSEAVSVVTTGGTPYIPVTLNTGGTVNATYLSGSGTSALIFRYTTVSGNLDSDGISVGSSITANGGTLKDGAGNSATLTLNSVGSTASVLVDAVAPTISSVDVPANNTYGAGENLDFTVNFSEAVSVVTTGGTPYIPVTLNTGGTVNATYLSGSGTSALVFRYTIVSGNFDSDGIAVGSAITANGGTLKDGAGNSATLTLNSVGSTTSVLVDAIAPTITSVDVPANGTYLSGENLDFTVNFNEAISVVTTGGKPYILVTLTTGGTVEASYLSGSGTTALVFRYTIVPGNFDNNGIAVGTIITANGGTLKDAAGNSAILSLNSVGSTTGVLVDAVAPTISSVNVPTNGTYVSGDDLDFTVNFSETVNVVTTGGTPFIPITLNTGGTVNASYLSGTGTSALVFRYTVATGNLDTDGIVVGSSITANGGTLKDVIGNSATLTLNSVGSTTGVLVDAVAPIISSVDVPANDTYISLDTLQFDVNFNEVVNVTYTSEGPFIPVTLNTGGTVKALYNDGTGTTTLSFWYMIAPGDMDNDGVVLGSSIDINDGTLKDAAGNSANLTLNTVGSTTGVLIDGVAPTVTSVDVPSEGTYGTGDTLDFTVNFDEAVTVSSTGGTPYIIITLNTGGSVNATYKSGTGTTALLFSYKVVSGNIDNDGITVAPAIALSGETLKDASGNNAKLNFNNLGSTTGVLVDAVAPSITSVDVPADGTYISGENLDFTVNFDENVTVSTTGGTPYVEVTLNTGGTVEAEYKSGSGTSSLLFEYTIKAADFDDDGVVVGSGITIDGGTIQDVAGNNAVLAFNNVGSTANVLIDAIAPTITSVGVPSDSTYIEGDSVGFTVNLDETVVVDTTDGVPYIEIILADGDTAKAYYKSGTGTTSLIFVYIIGPGDADTTGIELGATINRNDGTIKDAIGNNMVTTLNNVAPTTGISVDGVAPSVMLSSTEMGVTNLSNIPIAIKFSEPITGLTISDVTVTNGTKSNFTGDNDTLYALIVTPLNQGAVTINVAANVTKDIAGNGNTKATTFSIVYDSQSPTPVISTTASDSTGVSPIPVTVTFDESVSGFTVDDVTLSNGTASAFSGSNSVYTFNVTPTAIGPVTVDIAADVAQDSAGNKNLVANQLKVVYEDVTGINTITAKAGLVTVYPSVISGFMTLEINNSEYGNIDVRIVNTNGVVYRQHKYIKMQNSLSVNIDMGNIPNGYYLIEVSTENFKEIKRVVVDK